MGRLSFGRGASAALLASLTWGAGAAMATTPSPLPALQLSSGADVWSIRYAALEQFIAKGTFSDQRLMKLVINSGWPEADLRVALAKPYAVNYLALSRFLNSPAGEAFLLQQTQAYKPLKAGRGIGIEAIRYAILEDAKGGTISAMGILKRLPVPMAFNLAGPPIVRCSSLPCEKPEQCRSVLSWWVFLPACLQAAAMNG
ncbi:MAG: alpha/beta hydrolase [Vulcanococcus sp.]